MVAEARDLAIAVDRVAFARELGIVPDWWQEKLLRSSADQIILCCCRQSGKSTMVAIIALHQALYHPDSLILCCAPALRQSQEQFAKIAGFYKDLGRPVPAQAERKLSLELLNNSRIITLPGTEKTVRGFSDPALAILDEAAQIDDELYLGAVRPMRVVSGGRIVMLSTPFGRRGVFHRTWEEGGPEWERYLVPATESARYTAEMLEKERRSSDPWHFEQELMCRFMEGQVFAEEWIVGARSDDEEYRFEGDSDLWT